MSRPSPEGSDHERGDTWTAREIRQQPEVWRATHAAVEAAAPALRSFLSPLLARPELRIILTGAGSSAYIGRCLHPELLEALKLRVEAIATTDLVAGPAQYLQREVPTLLVSFARSGSSPESVAAAELADAYLAESHQLVITCNAAGELYRRCTGRPRSFALLLPEATHDRGFAMTSSFSSMYYAALCALLPRSSPQLERICRAGEAVLTDLAGEVRALAAKPYERLVFLGSRVLSGLADEASLKILELTDGEVVTLSNSPLGFRHGPKTFANAKTLVVVFVSNDPLARCYDLDLARELATDAIVGQLLVLSAGASDLQGLNAVVVPGMTGASDTELLFPYVVWAQLLALGRSLALGYAPDSPSRSGAVNRVVKGVTIYPSSR